MVEANITAEPGGTPGVPALTAIDGAESSGDDISSDGKGGD